MAGAARALRRRRTDSPEGAEAPHATLEDDLAGSSSNSDEDEYEAPSGVEDDDGSNGDAAGATASAAPEAAQGSLKPSGRRPQSKYVQARVSVLRGSEAKPDAVASAVGKI